MGQKVNPHGLRVGIIKDWDSRWFASKKDFGDTLVEDYNIRKYLKKFLFPAGISKVEIERNASGLRVTIHCAKPGLVIGKNGAEIEKLKEKVAKLSSLPVHLAIAEIKSPDMNSVLVAEAIAGQLERRASFRRAMKQSIQRTMKLGAKGIKINVSGRLGGAEIARSENYHEGTIPLQTLRADIDYGFAEANTTYGKIGIKVWIYKGEVLEKGLSKGIPERAPKAGGRDDRPRRRPGGRPGADRLGPRSGNTVNKAEAVDKAKVAAAVEIKE